MPSSPKPGPQLRLENNENVPHSTLSGSCHCGQVQYSAKISPPIDQYQVVSCNCSMCYRKGYLLVYPFREDVTWLHGYDSLVRYSFGKKQNDHWTCTRCGCNIGFDSRKGDGSDAECIALNIRMCSEVEVARLNILRWDGWNKMEPQYVKHGSI